MKINSYVSSSFLLFLSIFFIETTVIDATGPSRTGPIDISFNNISDYYYNPERILFVFNRTCAQQLRNGTEDEDTQNKIEEVIQQISHTYQMCLRLTNNSHNVTHYDTPKYSFAFFDIFCSYYSLNQGEYSNITIDYNDLCIVYIMYEPLYNASQLEPETLPSDGPEFACMRLNTAYYKSYGMDLLDSDTMDYSYSYPQFTDENIANQHKIDLHILDSGIQSDHVEFYPWQVIHAMGDGPATYENKYGDHGTHVAGIAGGRNYGASRNFTIYDYRVCEFINSQEMPCYGHKIFEALFMVWTRIKKSGKPAVINLSLGGRKPTPADDAYHFYFEEIIAVGGIPVVAAGNDNDDACYTSPAYSTNAITVGSYDRFRKKSIFSNWGTCVDIWAPGTSIFSAVASGKDDRYEYKQGTSMAAPYITGMVANLLYVNPEMRFEDIKTLLLAHTKPVKGGVCADEFECRRAQYICDSALVYDLPHIWTTLEIVLVVLGCIVAVCVLAMVCMWVVWKKKSKDEDEYRDNNWQYDQDAYDGNKKQTEVQHINPNTDGNITQQQYITAVDA